VLLGAHVNWLAHEDCVKIGSGRTTTPWPCNDPKKKYEVATLLAAGSQFVCGISELDTCKRANAIVRVGLADNKMCIETDEDSPSVIYRVSADWMTFGSGILCGIAEISNISQATSTTHTQSIQFRRPLRNPQIVVGFNNLNTECATNTRLNIKADNITNEGFTLVAATWNNSKINSLRVQWVAYSTE